MLARGDAIVDAPSKCDGVSIPKIDATAGSKLEVGNDSERRLVESMAHIDLVPTHHSLARKNRSQKWIKKCTQWLVNI
jgi:hypothetical protein